jgi:hypothetical protein
LFIKIPYANIHKITYGEFKTGKTIGLVLGIVVISTVTVGGIAFAIAMKDFNPFKDLTIPWPPQSPWHYP